MTDAIIPTPTVFPTVHLNGTGRDSLIREYSEAALKIQEGLDAACRVTCHGRDYYPQGRDAFAKARDAHDKALLALSEAQNHFQAIWAQLLLES